MTCLLAQASIDSVPANWLKYLVLTIIAGMVATAFVVSAIFAALQYFADKRRENKPVTTTLENDPLRMQKVYPSATVKELADAKNEHGRRLDKHDVELGQLWSTMRDEDKTIRKEVAEKFDSISRALGRIEGQLEEQK